MHAQVLTDGSIVWRRGVQAVGKQPRLLSLDGIQFVLDKEFAQLTAQGARQAREQRQRAAQASASVYAKLGHLHLLNGWMPWHAAHVTPGMCI